MIVFEMFLEAFAAAFSWANQLISYSGYLSYLLGIMIISIVFNKIISPMLRDRGSDRADRRRHGKGGSSENG